jgi:hypothetical protein
MSLSACLLLVLIWPASYFWSEVILIRGEYNRVELTTGPGWVAFRYGRDFGSLKHAPRIVNVFAPIDSGHRIALAHPQIYSMPGDYRFYFPLGILGLIMALVSSALVISHFLWQRDWHPGSCVNCGYDLRATPDRCPECGKLPQRHQ